jgi:Sushi repeat (SCR repeat)
MQYLNILDDCDKPEEPINGRVKWNDTGATYHCDPGYHRTGAPNRSCIHGRWSGDPPKCKKITGISSIC